MKLSFPSKILAQYPVVFVSVAVVLLALVILFMRGPKLAHYETRLADLERDWNAIKLNSERSQGLDENIVALESGLEAVRGRLMRVEDVAINYEFFYGLERATGVVLRQFSQGRAFNAEGLHTGKEKFQHFSVIPYEFVMSGTLGQILEYVDRLERQSQIVRIESLNISRPTDSSAKTQQLTARLKCHVLAEKHE